MAQALPALAPAEIESFRREGFLIKHAVMPPELCAHARDRLWQENRTRKLQAFLLHIFAESSLKMG